MDDIVITNSGKEGIVQLKEFLAHTAMDCHFFREKLGLKAPPLDSATLVKS